MEIYPEVKNFLRKYSHLIDEGKKDDFMDLLFEEGLNSEEVEDIFEPKAKGKKAAISEFDDENFYGDEGFNEDEFDDESFSDLSFDDDINSY